MRLIEAVAWCVFLLALCMWLLSLGKGRERLDPEDELRTAIRETEEDSLGDVRKLLEDRGLEREAVDRIMGESE